MLNQGLGIDTDAEPAQHSELVHTTVINLDGINVSAISLSVISGFMQTSGIKEKKRTLGSSIVSASVSTDEVAHTGDFGDMARIATSSFNGGISSP